MFDERRIRKNGQRATATVVSMQEHSRVTTNDYRRYDYVLDVQPPNESVFRVEMHETFAIMASKPQTYDVINVKYDAKSHETIFDFEGDPRFDLDAMRARTEQMRKETAEMRATLATRGITLGGITPGAVPGAPLSFMTPLAANPMAANPMAANPTSSLEAIERLVALRDSGALTQHEFDLMKAKLIDPS